MKESYYAKQFESMLGDMHYAMKKTDDGSFEVYDTQTRNYISNGETNTFENAGEVVNRLSPAVNEVVLGTMQDGLSEAIDSLDKRILDPFPTSAEELMKYLEQDNHQDVKNLLLEQGYGKNMEYLDLLTNHLDDVKFEHLFDEKFYDDIEVTSNPEPFIYVEQNDVMNVFLEIGTDTLTELLRNTEFEFGEQTEAVKYANKALDTEAADIDFGDLYVDFDMKNEKDPVYELTVTKLSGEQETYFSNSEGADRMKVTPEIEKAVINAVEQFSGKSLEETINDFRKECDKEIE